MHFLEDQLQLVEVTQHEVRIATTQHHQFSSRTPCPEGVPGGCPPEHNGAGDRLPTDVPTDALEMARGDDPQVRARRNPKIRLRHSATARLCELWCSRSLRARAVQRTPSTRSGHRWAASRRGRSSTATSLPGTTPRQASASPCRRLQRLPSFVSVGNGGIRSVPACSARAGTTLARTRASGRCARFRRVLSRVWQCKRTKAIDELLGTDWGRPARQPVQELPKHKKRRLVPPPPPLAQIPGDRLGPAAAGHYRLCTKGAGVVPQVEVNTVEVNTILVYDEQPGPASCSQVNAMPCPEA